MEPAKNKKSSPEYFEGSPVELREFTATQTLAKSAFSYAPETWEQMLADPVLKAQIDNLVESRVARVFESQLSDYRNEVREQARAEGLAFGRIEAKQELEVLKASLETICSGIVEEKAKLLQDHERQWVLALRHLLRRFLISGMEDKVEAVQTWLQDNIMGFAERGNIVVFLSPADWEAMRAHLMPQGEESWQIKADVSLSDGEMRFESEGAGFFFSPEEQWDRLDALIERFLKKDDDALPIAG